VAVARHRRAPRASIRGEPVRLREEALPGVSSEEKKRAATPYTIVEQNFTLERLQQRFGNRHAVFFAHPREVLSNHYERSPADPRIHALTLEVDPFSNVLRCLAVAYGRRTPSTDPALTVEDKAKQSQLSRHGTAPSPAGAPSAQRGRALTDGMWLRTTTRSCPVNLPLTCWCALSSLVARTGANPIVIESDTLFQAPQHASVDLVVERADVPSAPEYGWLLAQVKRRLGVGRG
jgi:hypothetical protein